MQMKTAIAVLAAALLVPLAQAEEQFPPEVLRLVGDLVPGVNPDRVTAAPVPGMYEVTYGPHIVYLSADGRYMLQGDLVDLETKQNLTADRRKVTRVAALEKLGDSSMIVFAPQNAKHTISVFTDVDCGYCRKMHREMAVLNAHGIAVRYLAFPRAGIPSASYDKTVSVWCADDPQAAMTEAKLGKVVPTKQCDNPVREHYQMGQMLGISGTPSIVLPDGEMVPGYVPAKRLAKLLDDEQATP